MPRPVLLVVDDDDTARDHLERDLDRRYGDRYRIVGMPSGGAALDRLRRLARTTSRPHCWSRTSGWWT
jgi:thioredoxin reductase (NADPH)